MYLRIVMILAASFCLLHVCFSQALPISGDVQKGYMLGPGDEVTSKVLGEPQFDFVATVDEDGKIEVPFFDKPIIAKCLTERELRTEVAKLLSRYLRSPQVSLRVTQRNSRPPATISGEVRTPQQIDLQAKGDTSGGTFLFRRRDG